ncbi:MAG: glycosyltransferase family 2 protein [Deltaproteobacteria bacterium]|nr:glycosyltransferase family 2 protein [Deltaproteobacteria bacterium]
MRPLVAASGGTIRQAVVIPALAERDSLFRTLAAIARNSESELRQTLVICVVNNHRPPLAADAEIRNNRETLSILDALVFGRPLNPDLSGVMRQDIQAIVGSDLRLAYIDASSAGLEIPERDGGVGAARKIGMDAALQSVDSGAAGGGVICCLDADTLVEGNYLAAIRSHFSMTGDPAAVSAYAHQKPEDPALLAAICCYEIFLRAYVIGLSSAGSPYAFHSIGSTMACTSEGYAAVRGMNRRRAAEDFHFLDKLAKIGSIGVITATTVFPSPRPSHRVPFGTGQRMIRFLSGGTEEYRLYDPRIFEILGEWLTSMEAAPDRDPERILADAARILPELETYLRASRFAESWLVIRKNSGDRGQLRRQFHVWFDGLKTLRLVHHLSRTAFPRVPMFDGPAGDIPLAGRSYSRARTPGAIPEPEEQYRILTKLRADFPCS